MNPARIMIVAISSGFLTCPIGMAGAKADSPEKAFCTSADYLAQICFTPPALDWSWKSVPDGTYLALPPQSQGGFHVADPAVKVATSEAVAAQLGRVFEGSPDPKRSLTVEESATPEPESFRFTYDSSFPQSPATRTIGYVTPSGWMVFGIFESGKESPEFLQFVRSYRKKAKS